MAQREGKAFDYIEGQFICHIYFEVSNEEEDYTDCGDNTRQLTDAISAILLQDRTASNEAWKRITNEKGEHPLHVTLVRGHWAVYRHQIKTLVDSIQKECAQISPFSVCLDEFKIFSNYEKSKEFLCIATRGEQDTSPVRSLRQKIQAVLNELSTQLTDEDESDCSQTHCSLLHRKFQDKPEESNEDQLENINNTCKTSLGSIPICIIRVNFIKVKIGHQIYKINLGVYR